VERETAERVVDDVGRRVAEIRRQRGWTQQDAAEHLRMPLKNFQRLEEGKMNVTLRTLVRIARGLGVYARALLDEPQARPKRRRGRPRKDD
jgi:transcriptional regulator with XRE-family HTH domain